MRFRVLRCVGILAVGIAAFFLAVMQVTYSWNIFFVYIFSARYQYIFWGYWLGVIGAAIFLSIEDKKEA